MSALSTLLVAACGVNLFGNAAGLELTYTGRLTPVAVAEGNAVEKGFSVTWSLSAADDAEAIYLLTEDAAAQPWLARFGFCAPGTPEEGPRIGYRFDDRDHTIPLPGMISPLAERLAHDREVVEGPVRHAVTGEETIGGRKCLMVESATNFGRETTYAVERSTGLIVMWKEAVFLDRGDRFLLSLELTQANVLDPERSKQRHRIADLFRQVAAAVDPEGRESGADLSPKSLELVSSLVEPIGDAVRDTPFEAFAVVVARNVREQQTRSAGMDELARKIVGSPAPELELTGLDGRPIDRDSVRGRVVVLHFWDYDRESLAAPYGQTGYLDFVHRRRGPQDVAVVGVAVNPAFGKPDTRGKAARSAKNLAEFMNLGYRLAADDGTLLRRFGDPQPLGARLPLWVVIDADGVVRHFKSGLYEMQPNEGLKELDAVITDLTRAPAK